MPNVQIGKTDKRINSTKQSFTSSTTLSCKLKEPCSMQSPVFEVQGLTKGTLYNFAKFENRYYWVDDVVYLTNNIQEVHCHLDVLATWKTAIGNTPAFVKYSNKTNRSRRIDDPRIQPEIQPNYQVPLITVANAFHDNITFNLTGGSVILRVMSMPDSAAQAAGHKPGVVTYVLNKEMLDYCLADLTTAFEDLGPSTWGTTMDAIASEFSNLICGILGILGGSGSWRDNILSCIYLPIDPSSYSSYQTGSVADLCIGNQVCDVVRSGYNARVIPSTGVYVNCGRTLTIPWYPDGSSEGLPPFMKNKRWGALQMQLPGTYLDIDTTDLQDQTELGYYSCINLATGDWSCKVVEQRGDTNEILGSATGCIGFDLMGYIGSGNTDQTIIANAIGKVGAAGLGAGMAAGASATSHNQAVDNHVAAKADKNFVADKITTKQSSSTGMSSAGSGIIGDILGTGVPVGVAAGGISGKGTELFLVEPATTTSLGKVILRYVQWLPRMYSNYGDYCDEYGWVANTWLATLSSNPGYTCCVGASVKGATDASPANLSSINSYLNSGFYYE